MSAKPIPGLTASFWDLVKVAPAPLLMLDYDGTLAPFVTDRDLAVPYPGIERLLERILADGRCHLVIVTGRAVEDIPRLLSLDPLPEIWGCHGWERRLPDASIRRLELPDEARRALKLAWRWGHSAGLDKRLEEKPFSVAVHWRGLEAKARDDLQAQAEDSWGVLAAQGGLDLHPFDGGLELRCPGRNKGDVVQDLLAEAPADTLAVYLGDDLTDEDAFQALGPNGQGILVRQEYRRTAAAHWLQPPEQLLDFLQTWVRVCSHGGDV